MSTQEKIKNKTATEAVLTRIFKATDLAGKDIKAMEIKPDGGVICFFDGSIVLNANFTDNVDNELEKLSSKINETDYQRVTHRKKQR